MTFAGLSCVRGDLPQSAAQTSTSADIAGAGGMELASLDPLNAWSSDALQSYRAEYTLTAYSGADQETPALRTRMWLEVTRSPSMQHYIMENQVAGLTDEIGVLTTETYIADGVLYSKNSMINEWSAMKGDLVSLTEGVMLNPQDYVFLPASAQRRTSPEEVNGVVAWHYSFDETDIEESLADWDTAQTEAWLAVEGGYLVKVEATMQSSTGASVQPPEGSAIETGYTRMIVSYSMSDINAPFSITVPEEAIQANVIDLSEGIFGSWSRTDVPLPEDAVVSSSSVGMLQAETTMPIPDATAWMKNALLANGWTLGEELSSPDSYYGTFQKEAETISLIISLEGSKTSIFITVGTGD